VAGGLVLLLILGLVVGLVAARSIFSSGSSSSGGGDSESGADGPKSPTEAIEQYLAAISDGDSATALSLLGTPPDDETLLTDEVLAASNALAPMSDIVVADDPGTGGSADVTVKYQLGDTSVNTTYSVLDYDDDGVWEISGGTAYLSTSRFEGLGVTVNGQEVDGDEFEVFPGAYEFATTMPNFAITGETVALATEPFASVDTSGAEPGLSDAALTQFRTLVQQAVDACLASTSLTAGCGLDVPATLSDGTQLADGTITRTLSAEGTVTIQSMVPTLSYDNPTLAEGDYIGSVSTSAQCTQGGATGTCDVLFGPSLGRPSIDMGSATPTVLWD
jgi:hypothetical protein